jgi:hypothetical protein
MESWFLCPQYYGHRYQTGLTTDKTPSYLLFGERMHQLLRHHHLGGQGECPPPSLSLDPLLELEAQSMLASYKASYPVEDFTVVDTEKPFDLSLPGTDHHLLGRIDMLVRCTSDKKLLLFESKTESRGSKRNLPEAWIARHQGSLYVWAATQLYGEPIDTIILNVLTRGSAGKQIGPGFRRDNLHRTPTQVAQALRDFTWVADTIDNLGTGAYPKNTSACVNQKGYKCEYYNLCHLEDSSNLITIEPYDYLKAA